MFRFLVPESNFDQFDSAVHENPRSFRMNLIDGQLDVLSTENNTDQKEGLINNHVSNWCSTTPNLVGQCISSKGYFALPNSDVMGADTAVVLSARWDTLTNNQQNEEYLPIAPNFVVELRSIVRQ